MSDFIKFLNTPAGIAIVAVVAAAVVIFIIDINYRYFTKHVLDFLFALIGTVILSPVLIACAIISKNRVETVFETQVYMGAKGKIIRIRSFAGVNGKIKNIAKLLDVLCGKMSFVGTKLMPVTDAALLEDDAMSRFDARPGLFCHLVLRGDETLTYEDMFELDSYYARHRELFKDFYIMIKSVVLAIRGEGKSYMGETRDKTYAEVLIERGTITEADLKKAEELAEQTVSESDKRTEFNKQRYGA